MSAVAKGRSVLVLAFVLAIGNALPGSSIAASASSGVAASAHTHGIPAVGRRVEGSPSLKREVFGFALASTLSDPTVGYPTWNFSLLSTVAFFGLHVQDDGTFTNDSDRSVWNSSQVPGLLGAAHPHGTRVLLTIVMQDFSPGTPHMCSALVHQATTISATVAEVKAKGVDGVNVDYEGLNGSCGTSDPSFARRDLTNFIAGLRSALGSGYYLSIDTYASSASDSLGFFDVPGMAPSVDSMFVMAYDLEYSNYSRNPPGCVSFCLGPTAPLAGYYYNDTAAAAQYAGTIALSKIILGVPYYGRKACVATASPNQIPSPSSSVAADSYLDASGEATAPQVQAGSYASHRDANDPIGRERWDTWFNTSLNCTRELYWDDATSLGLKYDLVNRDGLRGVGIWNLNYGGGAPELWSALATHFALVPGQPSNLSACAGESRVTVSWSPAPTSGTPVTSYQITANPGGVSVSVPANVTIADMLGLTPGTAYTVTVQAINAAGTGVAATSQPVTPISGAPPYVSYLDWYDRATSGVVSDNIHVFNPGASASSGCVNVAGAVVPWTAGPGQETYVTMPTGTLGGPVRVTVNTGPPVKISQRTQFGQSFNEIWAQAGAQAATTSFFNWFDKASPGMLTDNIHLTNPSGATANVTVSLPGAPAQKASIAPGYAAYVTFPKGTIGGPVTVTSDQPVLASQRVQFNSTFNETWALTGAQAATTAYLNWYDTASPGMAGDTIHLLNPGGTAANVTLSLSGSAPMSLTVGPGAEAHVTLGPGKIGGPVKISSSQPILATQRVEYYSSFNEVTALNPAQATGTSYLIWYDRATPGMVADNVHLLNPGTAAANVTVSLLGAKSIPVTIGPGAESYVSFPTGTIGGALTITSTQPLLASQRVQYYLTLNEIPAG